MGARQDVVWHELDKNEQAIIRTRLAIEAAWLDGCNLWVVAVPRPALIKICEIKRVLTDNEGAMEDSLEVRPKAIAE